MRCTRFVLPIAAVLGLAGFGRAAQAETTLSVTGVFCNNNGGGTFGCYVDALGGTGTYTNYALRWTQRRTTTTYGPYFASSSGSYVTGTCMVGYTLSITGTVTDSQGATASASTTFICRSAAD